MANFYSDGALAPSIDFRPLHGVTHGGKLHIDTCTYTADGTEVVGDFILLKDLPSNTKILPEECSVNGDATTTVKLVSEVDGVDTDLTTASICNAYSKFGVKAVLDDEAVSSSTSTIKAEIVSSAPTAGQKIIIRLYNQEL